MELLDVPVDLLEEVAELRLLPGIEARQQTLLTRKNLGVLTAHEEKELAALTDLSK
jgi:hypothetical protein